MSRAKHAYKSFHGEEARRVTRVRVPTPTPEVWRLGRLHAVIYEAVVDGERALFKHDFSSGSAPHLCVSPDGKSLFVAGGRYRVTDRGIEDR